MLSTADICLTVLPALNGTGGNGLGDEGADGAMSLPRILGLEPPLPGSGVKQNEDPDILGAAMPVFR